MPDDDRGSVGDHDRAGRELLITESIDVDFAGWKARDLPGIPVEYKYDSTHNRVYELDVVSVTNAEARREGRGAGTGRTCS
jgi:hypothetical protein